MTPSQRAGIRYERRVAKTLISLGYTIITGQWFGYKFLGERKINFCQPDIIILAPGRAVIVECKLSQRLDASDQLQLYYQVLAACDSFKSKSQIITAQVYHNARFDVPVQFDFDCLVHGSEPNYNIHWR